MALNIPFGGAVCSRVKCRVASITAIRPQREANGNVRSVCGEREGAMCCPSCVLSNLN